MNSLGCLGEAFSIYSDQPRVYDPTVTA